MNWIEFALGAATLGTIISIRTFKGLPGVLLAIAGATAIVQVFDLHARAHVKCTRPNAVGSASTRVRSVDPTAASSELRRNGE